MPITLQKDQASTVAQAIQIRIHTVIADVSREMGGADTAPDPHDLYDAALGACKSLTVL